MAVEPEPPDPTLIGFATEGLVFLNLALATKLQAPEIAMISREQDEKLATAWLRFLAFYISFAKAGGPMGALAAAIVCTIATYAPAIFAANARKNAPTPAPEAESSTQSGLFAPAL